MKHALPFKILQAVILFLAMTGRPEAFTAENIPQKTISKSSQSYIVLAANDTRRGLSMIQILDRLSRLGFAKFSVVDDKLPGLAVKACKNGNIQLLGVNRWGDILWQNTRGKC